MSGKYVHKKERYSSWDSEPIETRGKDYYIVGYMTIAGLESDETKYATREEAIEMVRYLNGSITKAQENKLDRIIKLLDKEGK